MISAIRERVLVGTVDGVISVPPSLLVFFLMMEVVAGVIVVAVAIMVFTFVWSLVRGGGMT
jgi:hypothetical protein